MKTENIRPKSIAREMVESVMSFQEYVREYGLEADAAAIVYGNALQRTRAASNLTVVMTGDGDAGATTAAARRIGFLLRCQPGGRPPGGAP